MLAAMTGLGLGVGVLIVVLSVINGFEEALKERVLKLIPHITLYTPQEPDEQGGLASRLKNNPDIADYDTFVESLGLASSAAGVAAAQFKGLPSGDSRTSGFLVSSLTAESRLPTEPFEVLLGSTLAKRLGLSIDEKVTLTGPSVRITPFGIYSRSKSFRIAGTFTTFTEYDAVAAFMSSRDLRRLVAEQGLAQGFRIDLKDLFADEAVSNSLLSNDPNWEIEALSHWTMTHGPLYEAVKLQKVIMWILLSLIIAVASFNVVSGIVGLIHRKRFHIAVLMTFGADRRDILDIFRCLGLLIALTGIALGLLLGVGMSLVLEDLYLYLEGRTASQLMSEYFVHYLPVRISVYDLLLVMLFAFLVSLLAVVTAAERATHIRPASVLRNE